MKSLILFFVGFAFLFSCRNEFYGVDNSNLKTKVPIDYHDITDKSQNDILYLVKFENFENQKDAGGNQTIFSIDNIQDNLTQSNALTIKESTPLKILTNRLEIIREECENENFGWTNFKLIEPPKSFNWKGYEAAEAVFQVEEEYQNRPLTRKIKRMVVFLEDDLWNFVLAPMDISTYDTEMNEMEEILNTMKIK